MPYVDWEAQGICKYWMLGGANRCYKNPCRWIHPPASDIRRLWDDAEARWQFVIGGMPATQQVEVEVRAASALAQREPVVAETSTIDTSRAIVPPWRKDTSIRQDNGVGLEPVSKNSASTDSAPAESADMVKNSNRQPLGKPNRLFAPPALTPYNSSSPSACPGAGMRTIWTRPESMQQPMSHQEAMMELDDSPARKGGFWAKEAGRTGLGSGSEVGDEVRSSAARADLPKPHRDGAKSMLPPPRCKRSKSPSLTTILTSLPEQQAQVLSELDNMGGTKRMSNGEAKAIGPHPSTIYVATRYMSQAAVEKRLHPATALDVQERSLAEAREDTVRLQGVTWLDTTRRALQLPIRTFTTACAYYHRFRLAHPGAADYSWADAAAAALLMSCKAEDTLKKSRDILAAAYNVKAGSHDALSADDVGFEGPSRLVIGLERLMLESSGFDFRSKYPHKLLVKICKSLPGSEEKKEVGSVAWTVATDLHRTFAPLKQTTATMALACLELAAHLQASASSNGSNVVREQVKEMDICKWSSTREEVMETLLDLLDLYTHHTGGTILGTKYSLDDFLRIRLALNKECNESNIPRFTIAPERVVSTGQQGATLRVANGHPTPVSPPQPGAQNAQAQHTANGVLPYPAVPEGGGTLRFMLNPQLAADEKTEVQKYYVEEWEEYDEDIEVPLPVSARPPQARSRSRDRHSNHGSRDHDRERERSERHPPRSVRERDSDGDLSRRQSIDDRRPAPADDRRSIDDRRSRKDLRERDRDRERDRLRDRDRERDRDRDRDYERDRARVRDRERDRRYDDRRYDDRDRYDRRERGRYEDYDRRRDTR